MLILCHKLEKQQHRQQAHNNTSQAKNKRNQRFFGENVIMRNYYIIIPSFIIQCTSLKLIDSMVYGHIKRYVDMRECFVSNANLAKEMGISIRCLSSSLQRLENNKIITRKIHYKKGTKQVVKRVISFVDHSTSTESIDSKELSPISGDNLTPPPAKVAYTPPAKVAYISIKNKNFKKKERKKKKESVSAAKRKAAQTTLPFKKTKGSSKRSSAVLDGNVGVTISNSTKRPYSSVVKTTQPESISTIAFDLEAQLTMLKEHIASAQTNYVRSLQTQDTIQITKCETALKNSERMFKRLLN